MKRFSKIFSPLLASLCLFTNVSTSSFASEQQPVVDEVDEAPYQIAVDPRSDLNFIGSTAYCTSSVTTGNANRIGVLQVLQKWGGFSTGYVDVPHANWIKCVLRNDLYFSNTFSGLSAGTYRVKSVFTLYEDGNREEITIYSATKTIS